MFNTQDNCVDEDNPWKGILAAAVFKICSTYHKTIGKTPGQLVFGREMIFPIEHISNWKLIRQQKQILIDKNNKCKNET